MSINLLEILVTAGTLDVHFIIEYNKCKNTKNLLSKRRRGITARNKVSEKRNQKTIKAKKVSRKNKLFYLFLLIFFYFFNIAINLRFII